MDEKATNVSSGRPVRVMEVPSKDTLSQQWNDSKNAAYEGSGGSRESVVNLRSNGGLTSFMIKEETSQWGSTTQLPCQLEDLMQSQAGRRPGAYLEKDGFVGPRHEM